MAEDPEWKPQQDQDMSLLCRVCANQHDYLIPIFQGEGLDHDMPTKMDKHLPIKVRETDKLPTQMCYQCASTIIAWSELHTNCLAADKKLKAMLKMIVKKPSTVETTADSDDVASDHYEDAYDDGGGAADDDDNDDEDFEKEIKQLISDAGVELGSKSKASKRQPARATTSRKRKSELTITPVKREPKKPKTEPSASKSSTALLKPKEEVVTNEDRYIEVWSCCTCERYFSSQSGLCSHILLSHVGKCNDDDEEEKNCLQCCNPFICHKETSPSSELYICDSCGECLTEKRLLRVHIKLEHNVLNLLYYTCKLCCKKLYSNSNDILQHLHISHKISNVDDLNEYHVKKLSDVKFPCRVCNNLCLLSDICKFCNTEREKKLKNNVYKLPSNCENHKDCHTCTSCVVKFEDCSSLWNHVYSNHKERLSEMQCNLCPMSPARNFKQPCILIRHMIRAHKKKLNVLDEAKELREKCRVVMDGKVTFQCPHCGQELKSFWGLREHMHIHTGEKSHSCTICQKKFRFKTRLLTHYKSIHENARRHKCEICGHTCNDKSNLNVHMRIHTGEKKYICEQCGATFAQWAGLYYHKFTHSDSKFKCSYCERSYTLPSDLRKHIKIHTEHLLYVCEVCGKVFNSSKNMRRHTKIHNTARPFVCEMCNASFTVKKYLTQHYKVHSKKSV